MLLHSKYANLIIKVCFSFLMFFHFVLVVFIFACCNMQVQCKLESRHPRDLTSQINLERFRQQIKINRRAIRFFGFWGCKAVALLIIWNNLSFLCGKPLWFYIKNVEDLDVCIFYAYPFDDITWSTRRNCCLLIQTDKTFHDHGCDIISEPFF